MTAGIKGEVVEDIYSIEGGPGEPWDFLFRLKETEDRELKHINIKDRKALRREVGNSRSLKCK